MPYKFRQMFAHTILEEYMSNKTVAIRRERKRKGKSGKILLD